ncbi:MAG: hypothetical protein OER56_05585 [Hyphomicrobiales bacterium]|nr:hypothetical protein [Hyphomicrobiales bacterium]
MRIRDLFAGGFLAAVISLSATEATSQGFSGLLTGKKRLPPITLASGQPLAKSPYELQSGKYYSIDIVADGSAELAIEGPEFFRNIWINEVVINDIEIRPLGLDSLEFDDEGKATITFVTIRPGTFRLRIPGTNSDSQSAVFVVK